MFLFLRRFKVLPNPLKTFSIYLFFLMLVNILATIHSMYKIHNLYLWHFFNYIEWVFMAGFFYQFYEKRTRKIVSGVFLFVLLLMLYGSIFINKINEINVLGFFAMKMMVIVFALIEIYKNQLVSKKHYYYLNIGTVIISTISLCLFTFWNLTMDGFFSREGHMILAYVNAIAFIVGTFFYIIEYYKSKLWKANH